MSELHAFQAIRVMELTSWSGRLWYTYDPLAMLPFQIQYVSAVVWLVFMS